MNKIFTTDAKVMAVLRERSFISGGLIHIYDEGEDAFTSGCVISKY